MATLNKIQFLRGLEANRSTVTPSSGEPLWTTDTNILYVGDGSTAGGIAVGGWVVSDGTTSTSISGQGTVTFTDDNKFISVGESSGTVTTSLVIEAGVTELASGSIASTDELIIKDVSEVAGSEMKKVTIASLTSYFNTQGYSFDIDSDDNNPSTVSSGNTVQILGGDGITTSHTGTDLTIDYVGAPDNVLLQVGNTDPTKAVRFDVETNVSTATTRVITMPDQDIDLTPETGSFSANTFKTISVSGQSDVVASGTTDALTFVAGTGVTIGTNAGTNEVTINAHDIYDFTISDGTNTSVISDSDTLTFAASNTNLGANTPLSVAVSQDGDTVTFDLDGNEIVTALGDNWVNVTGDTMTGALAMSTGSSIDLEDNIIIQFGTGDDVKQFFNGTSLITELESVNWIVRNIDDETLMSVTHNADPTLAQLYFSGQATIDGDLIVNGTTTTVNSTVVTIDDPVFTLGGDTAPTTDDGKDRGIEFRYYDAADVGNEAKIGFMGWDNSADEFTLLLDATNTTEVFSGTKATLNANVEASNILNAPWLETETQTLQDVTDLGATTTNAISITNTTDATSTATGSLILSGGVGIAKTAYVGVDVIGSGAATSAIEGFTIDAGTF